MIMFYNLQEDKILSNQHLLEVNHIKRTSFDILKIFYLVKKNLYQVSYYISIGLKVIFSFVSILFIQQERW